MNRLTWAGSTGTPPCGPSLSSGSLTGAASYGYDSLNRLTSRSAGSYTYGDTSHLDAATSTSGGIARDCPSPTSACPSIHQVHSFIGQAHDHREKRHHVEIAAKTAMPLALSPLGEGRGRGPRQNRHCWQVGRGWERRREGFEPNGEHGLLGKAIREAWPPGLDM